MSKKKTPAGAKGSACAVTDPKSGIVSADELLSLDGLKRRLGIGSAALRSMRRAGLPVRVIGNRRFVLGSDLLRFSEGCKSTAEGQDGYPCGT